MNFKNAIEHYEINNLDDYDTFIKGILGSSLDDKKKIKLIVERYSKLLKHKRELLHALGIKKMPGIKRIKRKISLANKFLLNNLDIDEIEERHALALTTSEIFFKSKKWKDFRFRCFSEMERNCVICGATDKLHLDHIQPRSIYPELAFDFNNMQILCEICNQGKGATAFDGREGIITKKNKEIHFSCNP